MNKKQAKKLFTKYVNNECSPEELELLEKFLDSFQNKDQAWSELEYGKEDELKKKLWLKIKSETEIDTKVKRHPFRSYLKYAAVFAALISVAFLYKYTINGNSRSGLIIEDESVTIKLENNLSKKIDTDGSEILMDKNGNAIGNQKGTQLVYSKNKDVEKLVYNEIFVPNGKTFQVILSDGTLVHLNAGTSLKYPVNFISGTEREVFLNGEAYFEVAKEAEHMFIVNTDDLGIKVLGTHFNVSSYKNSETYAVLAEGSVAVYQNGKDENRDSKKIVPGQKATQTEDDIKVDNVNIKDYLGWRTGQLIFNDESFADIIQKIERKYNVQLQNNYKELNKVRFKGKFADETLLDLLNTFKESAEFKYEVIDNQVNISKP